MMTSLVLCTCTLRSGTSKQIEHLQIPHFNKNKISGKILYLILKYKFLFLNYTMSHPIKNIRTPKDGKVNFKGLNNFSMKTVLQNPICIVLQRPKLTAETKTLPCARTASHYQKRMHNKHFHFM